VLAFEDRWMREVGAIDPHAVAICEAALLIEAGGLQRYDKLIVVTCTLEQKIARFAARATIAPADARLELERRMAAQMPEEEKARLADFVIDNSGSREDAAQRASQIWQKLRN